MTDPLPFPCYDDACAGTVRRTDAAGLEREVDGAQLVLPAGARRFRCDRCGDLWLTGADCDEEAAMVAATRHPEKTP